VHLLYGLCTNLVRRHTKCRQVPAPIYCESWPA
jgi:hypothetical protein